MISKIKIAGLISGVAVVICTALIIYAYVSVVGTQKMIATDLDEIEKHNVAIVFGAGINNDQTPSDMLDDRLQVAAILYHAGKVERILVSGDNSVEEYSEPDVMTNVLIEKYLVDAEDVYTDYAGRRTYDTCIRANELWGIESAILISQEYHLPRAIWTCQKNGISSIGASASLQPYIYDEYYKQRELFAVFKSLIDVYIFHPKYIGGSFIEDID